MKQELDRHQFLLTFEFLGLLVPGGWPDTPGMSLKRL
jgi:hypothetical protein